MYTAKFCSPCAVLRQLTALARDCILEVHMSVLIDVSMLCPAVEIAYLRGISVRHFFVRQASVHAAAFDGSQQ